MRGRRSWAGYGWFIGPVACVFLEALDWAFAGLWSDLGILLGLVRRDESAFRSNGIPILDVLFWIGLSWFAGFGWSGVGDLRST
jgi:hypothetical protein